MSGQPQPDRASSLPADQVFHLKRGRLTQIAGRPHAVVPKRSRAALSLVPQPKPSEQSAAPIQETK